MKVLLAQPVEKLGETGEVVDVASGYARNYLFPKKLALEPTPHNIRQLEKAKVARQGELRQREDQAEAIKRQLEGMTFTFQRTAQAEGKLYGSVRPEDIASAIQEQTGHRIERDRIRLEAAIDTLGKFSVTINLYKDISSKIKVLVEDAAQEDVKK